VEPWDDSIFEAWRQSVHSPTSSERIWCEVLLPPNLSGPGHSAYDFIDLPFEAESFQFAVCVIVTCTKRVSRFMVELVALQRDNDEERSARIDRLMEESRAKKGAPRRPTAQRKGRARPAKATVPAKHSTRLKQKTGK
jgi:hypothetical protein